MHHPGVAGDITAGLPPQDYGSRPYIEWYSDQNGRILSELDPQQVEVMFGLKPGFALFQNRSLISSWGSRSVFKARMCVNFHLSSMLTTSNPSPSRAFAN